MKIKGVTKFDKARVIIEALEVKLRDLQEKISDRLSNDDLLDVVDVVSYNNETHIINREILIIKELLKENYTVINEYDKRMLEEEVKLFIAKRYRASRLLKEGQTIVPTSIGVKNVSYKITGTQSNIERIQVIIN